MLICCIFAALFDLWAAILWFSVSDYDGYEGYAWIGVFNLGAMATAVGSAVMGGMATCAWNVPPAQAAPVTVGGTVNMGQPQPLPAVNTVPQMGKPITPPGYAEAPPNYDSAVSMMHSQQGNGGNAAYTPANSAV